MEYLKAPIGNDQYVQNWLEKKIKKPPETRQPSLLNAVQARSRSTLEVDSSCMSSCLPHAHPAATPNIIVYCTV